MASELTKYDESCKFKYDDLKGKGNCPTGVDATKKEVMVNTPIRLNRLIISNQNLSSLVASL